MRISFHPEAKKEVDHQSSFYDERSPGLGLRFILELEQTLDFLSRNPKAATRVAEKARRKKFRKFPFALIYRFLEERQEIRILAVAHNARRPGYWFDRLKS